MNPNAPVSGWFVPTLWAADPGRPSPPTSHLAGPAPIRPEFSVAQAESVTLALEAQAGSTAAFEQLVALFTPKLFGYLHQFTGNRHDAEDLTQETFLRAYRNLHRYRPEHPFSAWLFTIGRNAACNLLRSHRRHPHVADEDQIRDLPDHASPDSIADTRDQAANLWSIARTLKPRYFEVLWLHYAEDFPVNDIARILGHTTITIKVLLHRARKELGRRLTAARTRTPNPSLPRP